ncbi:kinase-like domain-containing protein [Gigaspora rosea]|uniref:Kinase-like domain-containing protein n=1 Tax=Gigaspora rosea TaxID=44941 RepID=A0A397VWW4_9GLOM|nr:kinase-like domain-containing protein [Gigaspora rosea]
MINLNISSTKSLEKAISENHIKYINCDQLTESEEIAKGAFGHIRKAVWKVHKKTVALKSLRTDVSSINTIEDFVKEIQLLQKLALGEHPNINSFYGISRDSCNEYSMVLEFASDGNLRQYLKINFSSLKWTDKFRMAKEITLGLFFLHNNNIIHRDLHFENILVNEGIMKIADFGLSTNLNEMSEAQCIDYKNASYDCGMPAYIDPQYFENPKYGFTKKSDIYSLGVILWEISSGKPPYQSFTSIDAIAVYIFQGKRETPIEGTPQKYINIYTECWDEDPHLRPDSMSVLKALDLFLINEIS